MLRRPQSSTHGQFLQEMPLGQGDVNYPKYLAALDEIGYRGFLTIERECDDTPGEDIANAAKYLRELTGQTE